MKIQVSLKSIIIETICLLYIILFVYAALSKLLEFENFQAQLGQSPLLSAYTGFISYGVLAAEFCIALFLFIPKTRFAALLSSFGLMIIFTAYIIVILNYSSFVPCSCGGILEDMDWKEHLIFNIVFSILGVIACLTASRNKSRTLLKLFIITVIGSAVIMALYGYSEKTMHLENPFIRRFIQGSASVAAETDLNSNSKYFAGSSGNILYLADSHAPLHIMAYDTALKFKRHYKIQLERENFPFTSVQVRIAPPYFYLLDGTVPVIYRGNISDWKGKLLMQDNNYYFSKAEIIAPDRIAFRAQQVGTLYNILGTFTFSDSLQVRYSPGLLQKQIDGFFDTDGMMQYDSKNKRLIYIYYYRNQYIIADHNLKLLYRSNTIDTNTRAKIKVAYIKEIRQRKIASLPATVNQVTAFSDRLLFINSKVIGRYESKKMWKQASIVDVYDIQKNTYLSSIYIYDADELKLQAMFASGNNLYVIIGHRLHQYRLDKHIVDTGK